MSISTLEEYLDNKDSLSKQDFENHFESGSEYYFIGH
jgi:hypothetical protein